MARYDATWGSGRDRFYDSPFRGGQGPNPGRGGTGYGSRGGLPVRYDQEMGQGSGWGGDASSAVYGPGRYGLGPYHERLRKRRRSDEDLREDVEEALFYDTWVDADSIRVEVQDGIVTLSGELPSYEEIRYATDDAWDVDGVIGVRSELTVRRR